MTQLVHLQTLDEGVRCNIYYHTMMT